MPGITFVRPFRGTYTYLGSHSQKMGHHPNDRFVCGPVRGRPVKIQESFLSDRLPTIRTQTRRVEIP